MGKSQGEETLCSGDDASCGMFSGSSAHLGNELALRQSSKNTESGIVRLARTKSEGRERYLSGTSTIVSKVGVPDEKALSISQVPRQ